MLWEYSLYSDGYLETSLALQRDLAPSVDVWIELPIKYKDDKFFGIRGSGYNNQNGSTWASLDIYNISNNNGTGDGKYLSIFAQGNTSQFIKISGYSDAAALVNYPQPNTYFQLADSGLDDPAQLAAADVVAKINNLKAFIDAQFPGWNS
jgi:hypothetical protein